MSEPFKLNFAPANDRGFLRADFKDRNGDACSIQESSLATEECIWLGLIEKAFAALDEALTALTEYSRRKGATMDAWGAFYEARSRAIEIEDRIADLEQERDDAIRQRDEARFVADKKHEFIEKLQTAGTELHEKIRAANSCGLCGKAETEKNRLFRCCENCTDCGVSNVPKEVFELTRRLDQMREAMDQAISNMAVICNLTDDRHIDEIATRTASELSAALAPAGEGGKSE